jgi:hypothetical protein
MTHLVDVFLPPFPIVFRHDAIAKLFVLTNFTISVDYEELAKKEHLTGIEVELRMLTNKLEAVRAEQKYQWRRERQFRNTSESTYERILWYGPPFVASTGLLFGFFHHSLRAPYFFSFVSGGTLGSAYCCC